MSGESLGINGVSELVVGRTRLTPPPNRQARSRRWIENEQTMKLKDRERTMQRTQTAADNRAAHRVLVGTEAASMFVP